MARKYEYGDSKIGWALDAHEERWLIGRYMMIEPNIPADQPWKAEFERFFFFSGAGVGEVFLHRMNQHCVRLNHPPIKFCETHVSDYARSTDRAYKSQCRTEWRQEWLNTDPATHKLQLREWESLMAEALPPHRTFAEVKAARESQSIMPDAQEYRRREAALATARTAASQTDDRATRDRATRLVRQLKLAATLPDAETLLASLMDKVEPADALDMAENLDDVALKTALLKRSMA